MKALIWESVFFILPAYLANIAPVVARKMGLPVMGLISKKWFGAHKSWLGLVAGVAVAILTVYLQKYLVGFGEVRAMAILNYQTVNAVCLGGLMGLGAILGDLGKSLVKRRLRIEPGAPFVPFDQIDFVVGALVLSALLVFPGWARVGVILVITPPLHFLTNVIGYALRFKKVWW